MGCQKNQAITGIAGIGELWSVKTQKHELKQGNCVHLRCSEEPRIKRHAKRAPAIASIASDYLIVVAL
jgi:hypothetical protein